MVSGWVGPGIGIGCGVIGIAGIIATVYLRYRSRPERSVRNPKPIISCSLHLASLLTQSIDSPIARRSQYYRAKSQGCVRCL